ncbi:MAG: bifunctional oligoribonuclease/PAP phosphatase NrnA [Oscillospiraceae bacterium]|nr:bifunctional oligoribonuclease/PAP phosphatase NrnA [Oscillospiraceae bacterium]
MTEDVGVRAAAELLRGAQDILILMHKNPDGDTLGSGFAMRAALRALGKRARAACDSVIPAKYAYMSDAAKEDGDFAPGFVLAVDIASPRLLGDSLEGYAAQTQLCIDHHGTNERYAQRLLCDSNSASCCEIIAQVIDALGVPFDKYIAEALYTGASTDTGCFKYSNTTADTHRLAARLIDCGIDLGELNFTLFEEKSRGRIALEQSALAGLEITSGGRIAIMTVTQDMLAKTGCTSADIEGITPIPRTIEGVEAGVTLRETKDGLYKVSLRTRTVDAAAICARFGGGGHIRAAGFECSGNMFDVKCAVVAAIEAAF